MQVSKFDDENISTEVQKIHACGYRELGTSDPPFYRPHFSNFLPQFFRNYATKFAFLARIRKLTVLRIDSRKRVHRYTTHYTLILPIWLRFLLLGTNIFFRPAKHLLYLLFHKSRCFMKKNVKCVNILFLHIFRHFHESLTLWRFV